MGGCAARYNGEVRRAAEEEKKKKKKKKVKNRSEGRGKCINDLVAAGSTGLHGHGWANGYYTATCAKKFGLRHSVLRRSFALCFPEGIQSA